MLSFMTFQWGLRTLFATLPSGAPQIAEPVAGGAAESQAERNGLCAAPAGSKVSIAKPGDQGAQAALQGMQRSGRRKSHVLTYSGGRRDAT